jgi:hypothetical protein
MALSSVKKETVTTKFAPQFAIVGDAHRLTATFHRVDLADQHPEHGPSPMANEPA